MIMVKMKMNNTREKKMPLTRMMMKKKMMMMVMMMLDGQHDGQPLVDNMMMGYPPSDPS